MEGKASLLSILLCEKDLNGSLKQLSGSDLSKVPNDELEMYLLHVKKTNLDLSRTSLTSSQISTVRLNAFHRHIDKGQL